MSIDPVTFVAQLVNLSILIFLMYKLLYRPLLNAIDTREAKISAEVKAARDGMMEAERRLSDLDRRKREIEAEKNEVINAAYKEAEELRVRLEKDVRNETAMKRAAWMEELAVERRNIENELRSMIIDNFAAFSKKALSDLADADLQTGMLSVLKEKFDALPDEKKAKMKGGKTAEVFTAYPLDDKNKRNVTAFLTDKMGISADNVTFKEKSALLCGMEIQTNGNVLSWNLDAYLNAFSQNMSEALKNMAVRLKHKEN